MLSLTGLSINWLTNRIIAIGMLFLTGLNFNCVYKLFYYNWIVDPDGTLYAIISRPAPTHPAVPLQLRMETQS